MLCSCVLVSLGELLDFLSRVFGLLSCVLDWVIVFLLCQLRFCVLNCVFLFLVASLVPLAVFFPAKLRFYCFWLCFSLHSCVSGLLSCDVFRLVAFLDCLLSFGLRSCIFGLDTYALRSYALVFLVAF